MIKTGTLVFGPTGSGEAVLPGWFLPMLNLLLPLHGLTYAGLALHAATSMHCVATQKLRTLGRMNLGLHISRRSARSCRLVGDLPRQDLRTH